MNLHKKGVGYFPLFIKDFGDDAGCLVLGFGLAENNMAKVITGLGLLAISLFLKYNFYGKD